MDIIHEAIWDAQFGPNAGFKILILYIRYLWLLMVTPYVSLNPATGYTKLLVIYVFAFFVPVNHISTQK